MAGILNGKIKVFLSYHECSEPKKEPTKYGNYPRSIPQLVVAKIAN